MDNNALKYREKCYLLAHNTPCSYQFAPIKSNQNKTPTSSRQNEKSSQHFIIDAASFFFGPPNTEKELSEWFIDANENQVWKITQKEKQKRKIKWMDFWPFWWRW